MLLIGLPGSGKSTYLEQLSSTALSSDAVRQLLEGNNQWDTATIIVMGDHSWRTSFIWKDSMTWTDEDETASQGGEFDPRPAYIVKLPNQKTPARIDQPVSPVTHTTAAPTSTSTPVQSADHATEPRKAS